MATTPEFKYEEKARRARENGKMSNGRPKVVNFQDTVNF